MARFLVTGGCGFIGSHLVDKLLGLGHDVVVLDDMSTGKRQNLNSAASLHIGDINDLALVERLMAGTAGCFHLAAVASVQRSVEDWLGSHRTNLSGSITVFEAARRQGRVPVVYASSAAVYGFCRAVSLSEDEERKPISAYGADKLGSELHGSVAWQVHGVPSTGLRFFNVYGPRQDALSPYSGVISIFANRLRSEQPITIFGDGEQVRDFIFVADVVQALYQGWVTGQEGARVFNICTGVPTSVRSLAQIMAAIIGVTPDIRYQPAKTGDIRFSLGNPAAARQGMDFQSATSLEAGLGQLLDHCKTA